MFDLFSCSLACLLARLLALFSAYGHTLIAPKKHASANPRVS